RHAINAAKIATIGHRDAQIGDRASERVDQAAMRSLAIECEILCVVGHRGVLLTARESARVKALPGNGKRRDFPPFDMGILTDIGQSVQRPGDGCKGDNWYPLWRPNYRDGQG